MSDPETCLMFWVMAREVAHEGPADSTGIEVGTPGPGVRACFRAHW
jgi:hypothetical protein